MVKIACLRDMIGLSNQALSTFATSPFSAFLDALPTTTLDFEELILKTRRKSVEGERGVNVIVAIAHALMLSFTHAPESGH